VPKLRKLSIEETNAMVQSANRCTRRLVDLTDETAGGTCVAIRIADKCFLATAAHVAKPSHRFEVVARGGGLPIVGFAAVQRDTESDVAALELKPADAALLKDAYVAGENIRVLSEDSIVGTAFLHGYPGLAMFEIGSERITCDATLKHLGCTAISYPTQVISESNWPGGALHRHPKAGRDLFFEYDPSHVVDYALPDVPSSMVERIAKRPLDLSGMSGGGMWLMSEKHDKVWTPIPFLLGIQVDCNAKQEWLRATRIESWLGLVEEHYQHLKPNIDRIRSQISLD
jgi:hypothetical protein